MQNELNLFFKKVTDLDFMSKVVDKSAFTHARKKITAKAYRNINNELIERFYEQCEQKLWKGLRILSIDGSTFDLPKSSELYRYFGKWKGAVAIQFPKHVCLCFMTSSTI